MISYGKQSIGQSEIDSVVEILKSDWLTQGPSIEKFENDLKIYFGASHVCAVSNGTAALHLAGLALGWGKGDIILTSPITFLASANSIVYAGATPDFVDIDPLTYTIDPNLIESKVKDYQSRGKTVKAIIGVDYAGHPCDWKALRQIADKYNLQLVNDNCHSMGASYLDDKQYAVKFSDVVTQSYHPVKHITTGEGGAILTNNEKIDSQIRRLRSHGITKDKTILRNNDGPWYYEMHEIGYNYRITDFQCALGSSQLKRLDNFVYKRVDIAKKYNESLKKINNTITQKTSPSVKHSYHLYPFQINFNKHSISKLEFFNKMKKSGVNLQVHYIPVHLQPFYMDNYGFSIGDFPKAENFYQQVVSLPIYPLLNESDIKKIAEKIKSILLSI